MDGKTEDFLQDLSREAVFDSQGEFQIDLARAREKLEQHLGLWPEDYLAFLIQGACALGAGNLRLSARWNRIVWEFDGPTLSRPELEVLINEERSQGVSLPLQRLQMAFFLLSKSRYPHYTLTSGVAGSGFRLSWGQGQAQLHPCPTHQAWSNRLELTLSLKQLNIHWLLSRRHALRALPEYASVRPRYRDGPVRLHLPWPATPTPPPEPVGLALAIQGRQRMAQQCPVSALREVHQTAEVDYSLWFATRQQASLRCLVYSLGYEGPDWSYGSVWLYCDGLRTDLCQRQLVVGPRLNNLLIDVKQRLSQALENLLQDPATRHDCMAWILHGLTHWVNVGGLIGAALTRLPLFKMAFHDDYSLQQLDVLYQAQSQVLYFCTEQPRAQPQGAPPVVWLQPEVATILRHRYDDFRNYHAIFTDLETRAVNRQQWSLRPSEGLELDLPEGLIFPLNSLGGKVPWQGQVALTPVDAPPRLDVFVEDKWLASVTLSQPFPRGLIGRVQHPDLQIKATWTEPTGVLWNFFLDELWLALPGWLAPQVSYQSPAWLLDRTYDLALAPHCPSQCLETIPLIPVGPRRASMQECRQALNEQSLQHWILKGWLPRDRNGRLLSKLIGPEDELRHWKLRLDIYQKGFDHWNSTSILEPRLPPLQELICSLPLADQRGEIGLRGSRHNQVQIFSSRQGRRLGVNTIPGVAKALGGLPEGLVVAIEHPQLLPNGDWSEAILDGPAWSECLSWIWARLPDLLEPLMNSTDPDRSLLALRLLYWMPSSEWPELPGVGVFCTRLDGGELSLAQVVTTLSQDPVRVLVDAGEELQCFPGLEEVWLLTRQLASELASIWGPSRLIDAQGDYLAALLAAEHGHSQVEEARLGPADWLRIEPLEGGEIGLRRQSGPANRCQLRLLRQGHLLLEHSWPLCEGPDHLSNYRLEAVVDWPDAPMVGDFQYLWENPQARSWLEQLHQRLRLFGFEPPDRECEFLWERLAYEAGARPDHNVGFSLELDEIRLRLLKVCFFEIEGKPWSLETAYQHLKQESRLGYVVGDPIGVNAGPILYLTARELFWLKLLLGPSQLANLSHLRTALKGKQLQAEAPRLERLPLPDLDYLTTRIEKHRCWGLQREVNAPSRVRVLRDMRMIDALSFDWRYQVQACLNLDHLQLNQDGSLRRDQAFQDSLDALRDEIQQAILAETPTEYRLELALWSWGVSEPWAEQLHNQELLRDARGGSLSIRQWVTAWEADETLLPYLGQEGTPSSEPLRLLPARPMPILPAHLITVAARTLRGLIDYHEGLRQAWQFSHQAQLDRAPSEATYQWQSGPLSLSAELHWVEQRLIIMWRGRVVHQLVRPAWPGYRLEVDWSERLLGQPWPEWGEFTVALSPYLRYLHNLLQQPDLLEGNLEMWEALPVDAAAGPIPSFFDPNQDDVRLVLARRKAEWRSRATGIYAKIQTACERWWGCPVTVEVELNDWPLKVEIQSGARHLLINPEHRWFRGQSPDIMAVRVCFWLQSQSPHRESLRKRNEILQILGVTKNLD